MTFKKGFYGFFRRANESERRFPSGMLTLIVGVMLVFSQIGCDNGTTDGDPGPQPTVPQPSVPTNPQSVTYVSEDSNGNLYTLVITENTNRSARYVAKDGDSFTFTVELFNNGVYSVALTYQGSISNATEKSATEIEITISVNNKPLTITITGTEMTLISGEIVNEEGAAIVETPETLSPVADKTALGAVLAAANSAKESVVVSVNGTDVLTTVYWVTQGQMDSFTSAIATAQAFYDADDADQSMVNSARIALVAATTVFNGQKQFGTKTDGTQDTSYDVYIAGGYSNGAESIPCYWKNDVKTDLPLTTGYFRGWAEKIIIDGNDIYVLGNVDDDNRSVGCYWKNGVISLIPNNGGTMDMAVLNGDLYIAGAYETQEGNYPFPCYWKNGIKTDLTIPEGGYDGWASTISVYGNSVYITGAYSLAGWSYPMICYWSNGARNDLITAPPTEGYNIYDIAVSESGVIIVGTTSWSYPRTPWYWKNNFNNLSVPAGSDTIPWSIALSNNDVFIAGFYDNGHLSNRKTWACYWKNGELVTLPDNDDGRDGFAHAISVVGNDVFIAGSVDVFNDFNGGNSTSTACYWKNGTLIELSSNASANGIFVVARQ